MQDALVAGPEPGAGLAWTLRVDGPLAGALNMARDHALALSLLPTSAVLRLYRWDRPTLSLGRNEPARGRYDREALRRLRVDVVRRPTGGRAVLHWRELTYAVALPTRSLGGPRATYRWIHGRLARALASLGVPAEIAPDPAVSPPPDAGSCFGAAAGGELTVRRRKLVGSAQVRLGGVVLQHGSILLEDDQGMLAELGGVVPDPGRRAAVRALLGRLPEPGELETAIVDAFLGLEGRAESVVDAPSAALPGEGDFLEHYESESWTWRR